AVETAIPARSSSVPTIVLTSGRQDPQLVPARVQAFTPARSVQPCSVTAARTVPAETLLHEQTAASSGSSTDGAPPPSSGSRNAPGSAGSAVPTSGRSVA